MNLILNFKYYLFWKISSKPIEKTIKSQKKTDIDWGPEPKDMPKDSTLFKQWKIRDTIEKLDKKLYDVLETLDVNSTVSNNDLTDLKIKYFVTKREYQNRNVKKILRFFDGGKILRNMLTYVDGDFERKIRPNFSDFIDSKIFKHPIASTLAV